MSRRRKRLEAARRKGLRPPRPPAATKKEPPQPPEPGARGATDEAAHLPPEAIPEIPNQARHGRNLDITGRALKRRWPVQLETLKTRCLLETNNVLMDVNASRRDKIRAVANVIQMDKLEMEQEKRNADDPETQGRQPIVNIQIIAPAGNIEVDRNGDAPHDP
jgi:hypothetical protein